MTDSEDIRITGAASAAGKSILLYLHDPSAKVIYSLLGNRELTEEQLLVIVNRKNLPAEVFDAIFKDKRWSESYPVRLALARNPKTPLFTALSVARLLRIFDLAEIARNYTLPVVYRKKVESIVIERLPSLPLGVKKTLAKSASGDILVSLIQDGYPDVVKLCLENPHLAEAHLYRVIGRRMTTPGTIRTIAEHPHWNRRPHIKFALVRNEHTPLTRSALLLPALGSSDLRVLYRDPNLPAGVRPLIHRELMERGENPELLVSEEQERVYEIGAGEMADGEIELSLYDERDDADADGSAATEGMSSEEDRGESPVGPARSEGS